MSKSAPYHHGHLRTALLDAAFEAARRGGPSALVVRDLARTVGVSPAAAYHHFADRDHLVSAVAQLARESLGRRMCDAMAEVPRRLPAPTRALRRLTAAGQAYLDTAHDEPMLIRTAFASTAEPGRPDDPAAWNILVELLDDLASTGAMDPGRRDGAEIVVWSAVHGLALLRDDCNITPGFTRAEADRRLIEGITAALGCPPPTTRRPAGTPAGRTSQRTSGQPRRRPDDSAIHR